MKTNTQDSLTDAKTQFMQTLRKQEINEILDKRRRKILGHEEATRTGNMQLKSTSAEVASQLLDPH